MIITVTPNPSIDKTIYLSQLQPGRLNRVIKTRLDAAAGKGVNTAMVLTQTCFGGAPADAATALPVVCLGFNYTDNGALLTDQLDALGIAHDFVMVPGAIRVNTKIMDMSDQSLTELNESGAPVSEAHVAALRERIMAYIRKGARVLTLSGSLPPGVPVDLYQKIITDVKETGLPAQIILDAEGELLRLGLSAGPDVVKPNVYELSTVLGQVETTAENAAAQARQIVREFGAGI